MATLVSIILWGFAIVIVAEMFVSRWFWKTVWVVFITSIALNAILKVHDGRNNDNKPEPSWTGERTPDQIFECGPQGRGPYHC